MLPTVGRLTPVDEAWWVCSSCHSINGQGANRCYKCRHDRPAKEDASSPPSPTAGPGKRSFRESFREQLWLYAWVIPAALGMLIVQDLAAFGLVVMVLGLVVAGWAVANQKVGLTATVIGWDVVLPAAVGGLLVLLSWSLVLVPTTVDSGDGSLSLPEFLLLAVGGILAGLLGARRDLGNMLLGGVSLTLGQVLAISLAFGASGPDSAEERMWLLFMAILIGAIPFAVSWSTAKALLWLARRLTERSSVAG
jgi:hypothetical protein